MAAVIANVTEVLLAEQALEVKSGRSLTAEMQERTEARRALRGLDFQLAGVRQAIIAARQAAGEVPDRAEGVISLARAFLVSGARAVVGSLWPLRDDEAALFFDRFYQRLAEGRSLDDALATARCSARATFSFPSGPKISSSSMPGCVLPPVS